MSRERPPGRHRGRWRPGGGSRSLAPRPGDPYAGTFRWVPVWLGLLPVFALLGAIMYATGYWLGRLLGGYDPTFGLVWAGALWLGLGTRSTVTTLRQRSHAKRAGDGEPASGEAVG